MNRIVPFVFCVVILTVAARTQPSGLPVDLSVSRDIRAKLTGEKAANAVYQQGQPAADTSGTR